MRYKIAVLLVAMSWLFSTAASACTLFAANGDAYVAAGGTIIAKNRDWTPEIQEVRLINDGKGFRYYGLFSEGDGVLSLKAGVNEKGLVVVSATAGSMPKTERLKEKYFKGLNTYLLSRYATVEEALKDLSVFYGPRIIMLADREKIAYVEIGPGGQSSVTVRSDGILAHTNHFINDDLLWANQKIGKSSSIRYQRIIELLTGEQRPFTLEQFIQFSEDKSAGPDNSIWRDGSMPSATQTMAAFIVHLPKHGTPVVYIKMRTSPVDKDKFEVYRKAFDEIF